MSSYRFGDMLVEFRQDAETGAVGLQIVPLSASEERVRKRVLLDDLPEIAALPGEAPVRADHVDSMIQLKVVGHDYPAGFSQGSSLRNSKSVAGLRCRGQELVETDDVRTIVTRFDHTEGWSCEHHLSWREGAMHIECSTVVSNDSSNPIRLELLCSFSLGGITPFHGSDAPERLVVHRIRSAWSAEGRLESWPLETLQLERSWVGYGVRCERFGSIGSMPVHRFFPFVAIEDTGAGVIWGAQLAWAGAWQMEVYRRDDQVCLSGGLADRETGHWMKVLLPGERLESPLALLTTVKGSVDDLCARLTAAGDRYVERQPEIEQSLPIVFGEWCTSWGNPTHKSICDLAKRIEGSGITYLVIDAGWYRVEHNGWSNSQGDWVASKTFFPQGLQRTAEVIRESGLIPGIWFEPEVVGRQSRAFELTDHLLKRDGIPITVGDRRFWDLNDPFVIDYLSSRMIGLLKACGFGYLKIDYNETIGIGCDHPDSLGEGLRQQTEGLYRMLHRIREQLPDLVIENCASGGHRLEPSLMALCAQGSFSDAHELREIPILAANLHRTILPRQSQVWAVLHPEDSAERMTYSLAATFLGRMCLSGRVTELSGRQWELVREAIELYRCAAPTIKHGRTTRHGLIGASYRYPSGWQVVMRQSTDRRTLLVVVHLFAGQKQDVNISLPGVSTPLGTWKVVRSMHVRPEKMRIRHDQLDIAGGEFTAAVALLSQV